MKNVIFLLAVMLMIFARSLSAQIVLNINGNVSDMNGSPIANHDVYFTDDTTWFNTAMAITNANGDYSGVFTASPNTPIGGILFVATEDCNFNMVLNTHAFTSTTPLPIISDFVICNSSSNPCSLGGASVNNTPNGLSVSINGGTPPYTYIWSNGTNGYWSQFYQNWCVAIVDANGCDTTICDTSSITQPCILSGAYVSSSPNGLTAGIITMPPNAITYIWSNGTVGNWSSFYQNWCVQIIDSVNGCDTTICDSTSSSMNCQAGFQSYIIGFNPNAVPVMVQFNDLSLPQGSISSWLWDFGDGTTDITQNPVHAYQVPGVYYACLTITANLSNGTVCTSTYCDSVLADTISIGPPPSWDCGPVGCYDPGTGLGQYPTLTACDTVCPGMPIPSWDCAPNMPSGCYDPGTGLGQYNSLSSCQAACGVQCNASFFGQDLGNNEALFTNTSYPQSGIMSTVDIDYGDGNIDYGISTTSNHTYASAGTYYVCVTVTEYDALQAILCTDTYCDSVTVTSGTMPCQADFCAIQDSMWITTNPNGTTTTSYMADVFYFCDLSTPVGMIQSWQWDMGDNGAGQYLQNTSFTSQTPVYEFDTNGVYNVCLTITTTGGQCTSTTCDSVDFSMMQGQTSVEETHAFETLKLYPNPANDKLTVNLISNTSGKLYIRLVNMVGQTLSYEDITIFNGAINHSLDISEIKNGVYSVEVVLNGEKQYQRLVISR